MSEGNAQRKCIDFVKRNLVTVSARLPIDMFRAMGRLVEEGYFVSMSELVRRAVEDLLKRFEGSSDFSVVAMARYDALKHDLISAVKEVQTIERQLRRYRRSFQELLRTASRLGLDLNGYHNINRVIATLLTAWNGNKTALNLFINLLEAAKKKAKIENELMKIRRKLYPSKV